MASEKHGTLIIIGGHEDREEEKVILREVARRVGSGKLVVTAVASEEPEELFETYERAFRALGVKHLFKLDVRSRGDATDEAKVRVLEGAAGLFFTGGDQLRITSQIGDTPVFQSLQALYEGGGLIAGTSAGASVLCETMLVSGAGEKSQRLGDLVQMAPGLGFIDGMVIDQHFAERGRMTRLLAAIAQNPKNLGVGIDENTAVVVERGARFYVLGAGAVYVLDGEGITNSNVAEEAPETTLSVYNAKLHVLSQGDQFELRGRRPSPLPPRQAEKLQKEKRERAEAK